MAGTIGLTPKTTEAWMISELRTRVGTRVNNNPSLITNHVDIVHFEPKKPSWF